MAHPPTPDELLCDETAVGAGSDWRNLPVARVERFLDAWDAAPIQRTSPRHVISKQSTMDSADPYAELVDTDLRKLVAENRRLEQEAAEMTECRDAAVQQADRAEEEIAKRQARQHAAWQVVQSMRLAAIAEGRDPYQDRFAQALSLALVTGETAEDVSTRSAAVERADATAPPEPTTEPAPPRATPTTRENGD